MAMLRFILLLIRAAILPLGLAAISWRDLNARWEEITPKDWKKTAHTGEREILQGLLHGDEVMEHVVTASMEGAFMPGAAVATDRRVLLLKKGKPPLTANYDDIGRMVCKETGPTIGIVISGSGIDRLVFNVFQSPHLQSPQPFIDWLIGHISPEAISYEGREAQSVKAENSQTGRRIDARWDEIKPALWGNRHSGEREMLHDLIEEGETLESLIGGTYRAEQDTNRRHKHEGIAVATSKRVLFVDKGVLGSSEVAEMPYRNIEAITYSTGAFFAGVQITGRGIASFRIEDIPNKDSVKPFVDCVRGYLEAAHAPQAAAPQPAAPLSAADEIEKFASLLERGILTQEEFDAKKRQLLGL